MEEVDRVCSKSRGISAGQVVLALILDTMSANSFNFIAKDVPVGPHTIEVQAIDKDDGVAGYPYMKYPSIKIARLAIDKRFERNGFGRFSVFAAIGLALSVSEIIGCRYLTVDSKPESVSFYKKLGFKIIEKYRSNDYPKMYLDMYPIVETIGQNESDITDE